MSVDLRVEKLKRKQRKKLRDAEFHFQEDDWIPVSEDDDDDDHMESYLDMDTNANKDVVINRDLFLSHPLHGQIKLVSL